jgi:hypothetical protein
VEILMRRSFLTTFVLAAALLSGCGSDKSTGPTQASIVGTWNLESVNGTPLPYVFQTTPTKLEVLSEQFVVDADGTFTDESTVREMDGSTVTTQTSTDAGTYSLNGTAVEFLYSDQSSLTASLSGNSFIVAGGGLSVKFVRQ